MLPIHPKLMKRAGLTGLIAASVGLASSAWASNFPVKNGMDTHDKQPGDNVCADSGNRCTLRAAIEEANAHPGWDSITVDVNFYLLSQGALTVTEDLDIYGNTNGTVVIDSQRISRVFTAGTMNGPPVYLYLSDLVIQGGKANGGANIKVEAPNGTLVAERITVSNGLTSGSMGGGVLNGGTFACYECEVKGNNTPIDSGGGTQHSGGGMFNSTGATAYVYYSTFAENNSTRGGGIAGGGYLELQNCTISGNTARAGGGGLNTTAGDAIWGVAYSTITLNKCNQGDANEPKLGCGFFHRMGSLEIGKSIIAGNIDNRRAPGTSEYSPDCGVGVDAFTVLSHWDNLWGNLGGQCRVRSVLGGTITGKDRYGLDTNPLIVSLEGLTKHGATRSHMPAEGSYPIDEVTSGNPAGWWLMDCPWDDQARTTRPLRAACDTGSLERP